MTTPDTGDERPVSAAPARTTVSERLVRQWRTVSAAILAGLVLVVVLVLYARYRAHSRQRQYEDAMLQALGRLVTAQEGFFYDSVRYAPAVRVFRQLEIPPGVRLTIDSAGARSWWGTATHDGLPGERCVTWVGTAPRQLPTEVRAPENEGKPICLPAVARR